MSSKANISFVKKYFDMFRFKLTKELKILFHRSQNDMRKQFKNVVRLIIYLQKENNLHDPSLQRKVSSISLLQISKESSNLE